jgi:membrane fusion protein, multidrug efflux system
MTVTTFSADEPKRPSRWMGLTILAVVTVLLVLLGVFHFFIKPGIIEKAIFGQEPPPAVVAAEPVTAGSWSQRLAAIGSIEAVQGVDVTSEVGAKVTAILFQSGQTVSKGQPLVRLDSSTEAADVVRFQAELRNAELTYQRQVTLRKQGWASQAALDQARAQLDQARAQVAFGQADVGKRVIRAPFSGRLGIRQIDLGGYVTPGQTIVSLQTVDPIYATFTLPESELSRLKVGQTVEVTVASQGERVFTGTVSSIDSAVDATSRNIRVQATLPNKDGQLTPGQSAQVAIVKPGASDALSVPETAVAYNMYGNMIFVLKPDPKTPKTYSVESRTIQVGDARDGRVQILSGVETGEVVVTAGQIKLREGMKAVIDNRVDLGSSGAMPRE